MPEYTKEISMPCFLIKKNSTSISNSWLGMVPSLSVEEIFGQIELILGNGGTLKSFHKSDDAFAHIRNKYPEDVGVMQVYEMVESPDKIKMKIVPWPK